MKVVITGLLGHISKPLTTELVQKGHDVTVISSNPEKREAIEQVGASAAIGSLEDVAFLWRNCSQLWKCMPDFKVVCWRNTTTIINQLKWER